MTLKPKLLAGLAVTMLLVACDDSDNATANGISSFGNAFVAMFNTDANDAPVDAQSIALTVDLTADPFNP